MMLSRIPDEVVSVARPGSSEGGSVPQFTVIVWSAARPPSVAAVLVPAAVSSPSSLPPQPAASSANDAALSASAAAKVERFRVIRIL